MEHARLPARVSHSPSYKARAAGVRITLPQTPHPLVSAVTRAQGTRTKIVEVDRQICSDMLLWVKHHWVRWERQPAHRPHPRQRPRPYPRQLPLQLQLPRQLQQRVILFRRLVPNPYQAALLALPLRPRELLLLPAVLL